MRTLCFLLLTCLFCAGCAKMKSWIPWGKKNNPPRNSASAFPSVLPATTDAGEITFVNPTARFVVVTFPIGSVPANEQRLNVYRKGLKVGEIKVTGPQRENNTVADILSGQLQLKDEARAD